MFESYTGIPYTSLCLVEKNKVTISYTMLFEYQLQKKKTRFETKILIYKLFRCLQVDGMETFKSTTPDF